MHPQVSLGSSMSSGHPAALLLVAWRKSFTCDTGLQGLQRGSVWPGLQVRHAELSQIPSKSIEQRYIASFHFITATMMAVGYGDIWAKNTVIPAEFFFAKALTCLRRLRAQDERLFCIVLQLFGATAFGFILSSAGAPAHPHLQRPAALGPTEVTSLLESANPRSNETNKRLNEIKVHNHPFQVYLHVPALHQEWCTGRRMPRHLRRLQKCT